MTEEFNLSYRTQVKTVIVNNYGATEIQRLLKIEDVKEFIKRLKEETRKHFKEMQTEEAQKDKIACALLEDLWLKNFDKVIDKLAGDKLTNQSHESNTSPAQSQKATDELGTTSVRENNQDMCKKPIRMFYGNMDYFVNCGSFSKLSNSIIYCEQCKTKFEPKIKRTVNSD